jgi:hypothetical protein
MVRMQIQVTEEQHKWLRRWADRLGVSASEAVRRCLADRLAAERAGAGRDHLVRDAFAVIGKYADPAGPSRVAGDHDEHLADAYRG